MRHFTIVRLSDPAGRWPFTVINSRDRRFPRGNQKAVQSDRRISFSKSRAIRTKLPGSGLPRIYQ